MIKHIVFIRIKANSEDDKLLNLNALKDSLEKLPSQISEIKNFEVGINISDSKSASDLSLIGEFSSLEDLDVYRNHPEHKKVLELISSLKGRTAVVDYEF